MLKNTNKKVLATILGLFVVALFGIFHPQSAHAALTGADTGLGMNNSLGQPMVVMVSLFSGFINFLQIILLIVLWMLQYLLQPDFFTDTNMMTALNNIWVLSRDIMNLLFALMLIGTAFYTIITGKGDYVKEHITRFIMAVILVNFSWFFPRVIIDISNVLTSTIFSIPNMMGIPECNMIPENKLDPPRPCEVVVGLRVFYKNQDEAKMQLKNDPKLADAKEPVCYGIVCYRLGEYKKFKNQMAASHAMVNGLAVSFARIATIAKVPTGGIPANGVANATDGLQNTLQLFITTIAAFLVMVAIALPLMALSIGLLLRVLILWVTIAFMPFAFLGYVISGKLGTDFLGEDYLWANFVSAAFLPTIVAIPFTIGFVMLSAVSGIPEPSGFDQVWGEPILYGVKGWWSLMWLIASVMVIYVGAFTALQRNKIVSGFTDKIKGFGDSFFKTAGKLPLLTPLPFPGSSGMTNLGGVLNSGRKLSAMIDQSALTGVPITKLGGTGPGGKGASDNAAVNASKLSTENTEKIVKAIAELKDANTRSTKIKEIVETGGDELKFVREGTNDLDKLQRLEQLMGSNLAPPKLKDDNLKTIVRNAIEEEKAKTK